MTYYVKYDIIYMYDKLGELCKKTDSIQGGIFMRNYEEIFRGLKGISREELENRMSEIEKVKMQKFELSGRASSEEGLNRDIKNLEKYFAQYNENIPEEEKSRYEKAKARYEQLKAAKARLDAGKVDYEKSTYPEYDSFSIKDCKREENRLAVWAKIREPMEEEWDKVSSRRSELDKKLAEVESEYNAAKEIEDKHQALEKELKELEEYFENYEKTMLGNNYQENKELFDKTVYKEKQARYKEVEEERKALPESNFKEVSEKTNKLREKYNSQELALSADEDKMESKVAFFTDQSNWETVMKMSDEEIREKITGRKQIEKSATNTINNNQNVEKTVNEYRTMSNSDNTMIQNDTDLNKNTVAEKQIDYVEENSQEDDDKVSLIKSFEDKHPILAKIPFLANLANKINEKKLEKRKIALVYYSKYRQVYGKRPGILTRFSIRNFKSVREKIQMTLGEKFGYYYTQNKSDNWLDEDYKEDSIELKDNVELVENVKSEIDPNSFAGRREKLNKQLNPDTYNTTIEPSIESKVENETIVKENENELDR